MKLQKTNQMRIKILGLIAFVYSFGFAQTHKGTIENIKEDGFHKIKIAPEVRSASRDNLDYFRILDKNKKEIPYVVFKNTNRNSLYSEKLEVINKSSIKDSISSFVVMNYNSKYNGELSLLISNSKINKYFSVSGSNNQKEWFGLVSNQLLSDLNNENGTSVEKVISFPSNNYTFLKIEFEDKNSLPINILNIGYYKGEQSTIETSILNDFQYKITENKKDKKSIITFSADHFQKVDEISFTISNKLFSRNAKLFVNRTRTIKRQTENYQEAVSSFVLNSNTSNSFQLNGFFEKEFTIEIENQDNQPLEFLKIELLQNSQYVIADLKTNEQYEVSIDSTLTKPQYDLNNFIKESKIDYPKAIISNFTKITSEKENASEKPFWQSKAFMWICILFGIAIIGYFSIGLLKDMKE
ncbi:MAG: hypothetical protein ACI924_000876 [Flavobacterium sp.]|jgi:hypothetical protein